MHSQLLDLPMFLLGHLVKEGERIKTNNTVETLHFPTSFNPLLYELWRWELLNRDGKQPFQTGNGQVTEAIMAIKDKDN